MAKYNKNEVNTKIGERLRLCRKEKKLTMEALASIIENLPENNGMPRTPQQIGYIERGERKLSGEWATLLSIALNVRVEYLLCKDDFKTSMEYAAYPAIASLLSKRARDKSIESFLGVYGLEFVDEYIGVSEEFKNITTEAFCDMSSESQEEFLKGIEYADVRYMLKNSEGQTIVILDEQEKRNFIEEICDFVEFKLNRMIERK